MTEFDPAANLAARARKVEEAVIIQMAQKARELRAKGLDIVSLTIGEPDFDTPDYIRTAAKTAMDEGFTHYAPMPGFPELRQAIAHKLQTENGLDYGPDEVVLSNGSWTESFQPGDHSLNGIDADQRDEIFKLFPDLQRDAGLRAYRAARQSLKAHEARMLRQTMGAE